MSCEEFASRGVWMCQARRQSPSNLGLSTSQSKRVVVDLTGITFLGSVGIRELITNAKALQQRNGKMVIFVGENHMIAKALETTGIDALIPLFTDLDVAENDVLS